MAVITVEYTAFAIRASNVITDQEDILYCLANLFNSEVGSWPLNRDFGLDWSALDKPTPDFKENFTLEVIEKVEKYEPRVTVTEVTFSASADGKVYPTIYIEGNDEDESE